MRHLKKFENFDFKREDEEKKELIVPNVELEDDNEDEEEKEDAGADEDNMTLEKFSAFNEKKASPAQLAARKAFADRIKGKKSDKKDDKKEDDDEGKTPKTKKEKELAAKFPPKDKITKGDFIKAAIDNKKKKEK